jgi:tyrosine-protein kinase
MNDGASLLRHYGHVLRRRVWVLLAPMVLVPAVAVLLASRQDSVYEASSQVLLTQQTLAQTLAGLPVSEQSDRAVVTQAGLARVPAVARRVLRRVPGSGMTVRDFLARSSAATQLDSDLLDLSVQARTPRLAVQLASAYAEEYASYRRILDSAVLGTAQRRLDRQLRELRAAGGGGGPLARALTERQQQLSTLDAFGGTSAAVVRRPDTAAQVEPRPLRALALGLALGLVFGIGLALLWEELDTRVRSADEIARRLGMPLLARLPGPPRPVEGPNELTMLAGGDANEVEPVRILRANLELVNLQAGARSIMLTSALEAEGTSTTAANLAVALARVGVRVALVDLDGRGPAQHRLFGLRPEPGVIDVVLGATTLERALAPVEVDAPILVRGERAAPVAARGGKLMVLPFGDVPANAAEFVISSAVSDLLNQLRSHCDLALVDAPPLLVSGEAVALTSRVDGVLVVANERHLRRHALDELARLLAGTRAAKLGVAVTGVSTDALYGYEQARRRKARPVSPQRGPAAPEVGS